MSLCPYNFYYIKHASKPVSVVNLITPVIYSPLLAELTYENDHIYILILPRILTITLDLNGYNCDKTGTTKSIINSLLYW